MSINHEYTFEWIFTKCTCPLNQYPHLEGDILANCVPSLPSTPPLPCHSSFYPPTDTIVLTSSSMDYFCLLFDFM